MVDESRGFLGTLGVGLMVMLFLLLGLTHLAHAEDMHDIRMTRHGCQDLVVPAAWTTYTSASFENMQGSAALAGSLYWTELFVKAPDVALYICEAAAASCGADTTNKMSVAAGASLTVPLRGLGIQSLSLYGTGIIGTTVQVCGGFRSAP